MFFPLVATTIRPEHCDPLYLMRELGQSRDYIILLESTDRHLKTHDYSFLALGARDVIEVKNGVSRGSRFVPDGRVADALSVLSGTLSTGAEGERLRMGYIGFLTYEAARHFNPIDLPVDETLPDAQFILPEVLLKIDHKRHEIAIIAHRDTKENIADIERVIERSSFRDDRRTAELRTGQLHLATLEDLEPLRQTSREQYCRSVAEAQELIAAGEIFQIVLSQEFLLDAPPAADAVYAALRDINPSPYMIYFRAPELTLVGASPEMLVCVDGRRITYRPIAGTRPRTGEAQHDRRMMAELRTDSKERCEHQMLVDLGRNDVGKVSKIGSVRVENPFHVEQYAHVFHIVSDVLGEMRDDVSSLDVVRSVFPAGTLTGAPKLRAMEIIRELESTPRGVYGGALGYIDLAGNVDLAITIRTILFRDGTASLRVGAGIVKDSVPKHEDNECLFKARSILAAVHCAHAFAEP